jgi:hypothetical protein
VAALLGAHEIARADDPGAEIVASVSRDTVVLPERVRHADYIRHPVPAQMMVPEVY